MGDLLYAFTEWLRTTPLIELSLWISNTQLSLVIGSNFWVIPILQTLHILAIAASFSAFLMMSLRILGVAGGSRTLAQTSSRYMPWVWWSILVLVITGLGMIIGEPVRELINPVFWIKVVLIFLVIGLSLGFQSSVRQKIAQGDTMLERASGVRAGAVGIILLWCATMAAGRWIAYAPV